MNIVQGRLIQLVVCLQITVVHNSNGVRFKKLCLHVALGIISFLIVELKFTCSIKVLKIKEKKIEVGNFPSQLHACPERWMHRRNYATTGLIISSEAS